MICTSNRMIESVITNFFCIDSVKLGDPVFEYENDNMGFSKCSSFKNRKGGLIGISLYHVLDIDLCTTKLPHNATCIGSRIHILTKGWIVYQLNPKWKIPHGQKLYCSPDTGEITWRKSNIKIGKASSTQDKDGFIMVDINI